MYNIRYQRNTVGGKRTIPWSKSIHKKKQKRSSEQLVVELLRLCIMKSTFIG